MFNNCSKVTSAVGIWYMKKLTFSGWKYWHYIDFVRRKDDLNNEV